MRKKFEIFDSTLRDGAQGEDISFSVQDKVSILEALDNFGVDYIEAGNPAANPKDALFFKIIKEINLKNSKLVAFGSTVHSGKKPEDDEALAALCAAGTETVAVFGKVWDLHVKNVLGITLEENLGMIKNTVEFLKEKGKEVIFDAEHFFDGYKENPEYAVAAVLVAKESGADCICLCDTNGGTMPFEITEIINGAKKKLGDIKLAIHCHDDSGCAVANTILAAKCGISQIQGTFNGFGERCGNTNLSSVIPDLILKCGMKSDVKLEELKETAGKIAEISNVRIRQGAPYVGKSAFSHKAGMHIDGVKKDSRSFEHINPELVGNTRRFLVSEMSGRGMVLSKIQKFLPDITKNSEKLKEITEELKKRELFGFQYEGAEASFELLLKKMLGQWEKHFEVIMYKVSEDFPAPDGEQQSNAIVKIQVGDETELACDSGNGPVNALDNAIKRALKRFYPEITYLQMNDYKVRIIDSKKSESKTRVLYESITDKEVFTTIGVSTDIIEASFDALVDSAEYMLSKR